MILKMLIKFITEMIEKSIDATAFAFSAGKAVIRVLIMLDGDNVDMLLAIRGFSAKDGSEVSRIFAYRLTQPYTSVWIEPEDYQAIVDLLQPGRTSGSCGSQGNADWEPFNLFAYLEQHLPDHPVGGAEARKAVDDFREVMKNNVKDKDKPYFCGFVSHARDGKHVTAQNLAKTLAHGSYAAYRFCADHNVSTAWTAYPNLAKDLDTAMRDINVN